ncbi:aminoacetone oxidase family FAD-binding enzyme [Pseudodesulfovibrio cashew]|uniref:Aminoacetone oxidase family FAD-binding enzyme n=1 Tax=Pseudodesulfovibrio cashew TaxID=2678688 RepID=A0A6I6JB25_9BACT|nr:NAD(P)/FAD-dependent oxidoreductase [Pseudodesulfovibrio cashew]QGY39966.1 aminoacetone oxidase family FAD-binding enzyme [Pseudodesulfovibrio cashew]
MTSSDILILGAGASGLYCAMHAARRGRTVTVLDHGKKPARKVRVAGGGKANFTNLSVEPENFLCRNPHFVKSALARHTNWDVIAFFAEHGISYEERDHGRLFSREGAGRMAGILADQCHRLGVELVSERPIDSVEGTGPFRVRSGDEAWKADKLVLALGGPSWPQVGATDLGFRLAKQFGLPVVRPRPGLVPLVFPRSRRAMCEDLAGNALPVTISCDGHAFSDALLFTHKGVSGPAVLQISSHWREGKAVLVDFLPGDPMEELVEANRGANTRFRTFLGRMLPKRLVAHLVSGELAETPVSQLSKAQIEAAANRVHRFRIVPASTEGYAKAEVTVGGVDTDAISSKTFEAVDVPGLHVIGETLDVTGHLGGYNLQWAFSSGAACAETL